MKRKGSKILAGCFLAMLVAVALVPLSDGAYPTNMSTTVFDEDEIRTVAESTSYSYETSFPNARNIVETSGGTLYIVYSGIGATNEAVRISSSWDDGDTWSTSTIVYENTTCNVSRPAMAIDSSNNLHIVFSMNVSGNYNVYYLNGTITSWGTPIAVTANATANDTIPAISIDSNDVAHVVWQVENITHTTYGLGYANNSAGTFSPVTIKGQTAPTATGNWSYLYPSISVNSTDVPWISYNAYNHTHDYFQVGILNMSGGVMASNSTWSWNQSRNACISINSTDVVHVAFKSYNATLSNVTHAYQDTASDMNNWTFYEVDEYTNQSYTMYPSIALSSTDQVLITATPTHIATNVNYFEWWLLNSTYSGLSQNGRITGDIAINFYMFSNLKWSLNNNNNPDEADCALLVDVAYNEIQYFGAITTPPDAGYSGRGDQEVTDGGITPTTELDGPSSFWSIPSTTATYLLVGIVVAIALLFVVAWRKMI